MNDLAHRLNRSVELDNDCCCFALSEAHTQQARQFSRILVPLLAPAWVEG